MRPGLRLSLSLLISVLLFAAFAVAAFLGLFDLIDTRFYHPAVQRQAERSLAEAIKAMDAFIGGRLALFQEVLDREAVKQSFLASQSQAGIDERAAIFARLLEDPEGIQGARFLEADLNRVRIHYSTWENDVRSRDGGKIVYRDWGSLPSDRPYSLFDAPAGTQPRLIITEGPDALHFCYPFADSNGVHRGTAVFSMRLSTLADSLVRAGVLRLSDDLLALPGAGFAARVPTASHEALLPLIAERWAGQGPQETISLLAELPASSGAGADTGRIGQVLVSARGAFGARYGFLMPTSAFSVPPAMRAIFLAAAFVTSFLVVFLLFNLRQESVSAVRDRVKRLQIGILEEYFERKGDIDFSRWSRELENRRAEVRAQIKASAGISPRKPSREVDELIDKGWDEILDILGKRARAAAGLEEAGQGPRLAELEAMMRRLLAAGIQASPSQAPLSSAPARAEPVEELAEAEAVEELPEAEAVEELAEAEAVEELPEAETVEEIPKAQIGEAILELDEEGLVEEQPRLSGPDILAQAGISLNAIFEELSDEEVSQELGSIAVHVDPDRTPASPPVISDQAGGMDIARADQILSDWMKPGSDVAVDVEYLPGGLDEPMPQGEDGPASSAISGISPPPSAYIAAPLSGQAPAEERKRYFIRGASITEDLDFRHESLDGELEALQEDWELSLASLDLSSLAGLSLSESGSEGEPGALVDLELEEAAERSTSEEAVEMEELAEVVGDEIPMLSDEMREAVEELALAEDEHASEAPSEAIPLRGLVESYVPFFARGREYHPESERLEEGQARLEELEPTSPPADEGASTGSIIRESDGLFFIEQGRPPRGAPPSAGLDAIEDTGAGKDVDAVPPANDPAFSALVESVLAAERR